MKDALQERGHKGTGESPGSTGPEKGGELRALMPPGPKPFQQSQSGLKLAAPLRAVRAQPFCSAESAVLFLVLHPSKCC